MQLRMTSPRSWSAMLLATGFLSTLAQAQSALPCTSPPANCTGGTAASTQTDDDFYPCVGAALPCWPTGFSQPNWNSEGGPFQVARLQTDKFVPAPGQTLIQAVVTVTAEAVGTLKLENRNTSTGCQDTITLDLLFQVAPITPVAGMGPIGLTLQQSSDHNLGAFDNVVDFGGTSGVTVPVDTAPESACFRITDPGLLLLFTDTNPGDLITEQFEWSHATADSSSHLGCGTFTFQSDPLAKVTVSVEFKVCSVVLADCDDDGIPDVDEIANGTQTDVFDGDGPDFCVPNGIPDECEAFEDCDFDGIPDACDDPADCECRPINRQVCGSLLLYPEFDSRRGRRTLITVTNSCCDEVEGNVVVEFRWINKLTCLETNRSFSLTPCDTLTFYSDAIEPNERQGYIYAYARRSGLEAPGSPNPLGAPIVFNHLIGQELVFDGISANSYALNAVSFRGIGDGVGPNDDGEVNDDDNDGVRDLNGPNAGPGLAEYEEAPDKILIPRFLGQDEESGAANGFAPDIFHSELILIALSGGAAFDTTVFADIYNDNEEPFSTEYTFHCWDKPKLRDFSTWTLQSSLEVSDHDPQEILGAPYRESGWMRLDGQSASSTQETIINPAIYAVLVEKTGAFAVADLPWEECNQSNGDLLPLGLFGDPRPVEGGGPPVPQNGDNQ